MADKVYWKSLRLVIGKLIRYISKWSTQLSASLTEEQYEAVIELQNRAQLVLNILPVDTPVE